MKQNEITALADERKMFGYTKQLSHEELAVLKDEMSDQSIKERELKIELKEMTKEIKDRMKPITKVKNELLEKIKAKAEFVDEMCSIHFDHEKQVAIYYSENTCEIVCTRPLNAEERQTNIKFLKTGTDEK